MKEIISLNKDNKVEIIYENGYLELSFYDKEQAITFDYESGLTSEKLEELSNALASVVSNTKTVKESNNYYIKTEDGRYCSVGKRGDILEIYDNSYGCNISKNTALMCVENNKDKNLSIFYNVEMYPRKIGNISHPLHLDIQNYVFYTNTPIEKLKSMGFYDTVVDYIKNYKDGKWDWILQSISLNLMLKVD